LNNSIAIIILNWNGRKLLEEFLPSVIKYSGIADIYLADNASTDNSIAFVKEHFPQIRRIQNKTNGGYAKGYNEALKQVDADIFCLLNSDVEVTSNWLLPILDEFDKRPETAIIQPKILDYKNKAYFEYAGAAGGFIDKYAYPFCRGRVFDVVEEDNGQYDDNTDIFWASGACLFIRSEVFEKLNGFDETYFAHFEEIDLCWRAFNLDYKTRYVANSIVYHLGGGTLDKASAKKTYLNFRNSLFSITKNADGIIFGIVFMRLTLDGIAALTFISQWRLAHFLAVVRAHFSYYRHLPLLLGQRKGYLKKKSNYFKIKSIVWRYFIKKTKRYQAL